MDVCVLIPCFNNLEGLRLALKSIVYQPEDLSVLIVDDGSTPAIANQDLEALEIPFKLNILRLEHNAGITNALNKGLEWIVKNLPVKYIARLDCGDTCSPDRFYKQVSFLNENSEIGLVGSWCTFQKAGSDFFYKYTTPLHHQAIVREMHYRNVFIHPTVMFRATVLAKSGFYPENYPYVEDYAFFMKIAEDYQTAVIPKFLVTCEISAAGISMANRKKQLQGRQRVVTDFGKSPIHKKLGILRLKVLEIIPYSFILNIKRLVTN